MTGLSGMLERKSYLLRLLFIVPLLAGPVISARSSTPPPPPVSFSVLNIDPSPVLVGQSFAILVRVSNQSSQPRVVVFTCKSGITPTVTTNDRRPGDP